MSKKLGDQIAAVTSALGITPCEECKLRQQAMNAVDFTKHPLEVYNDLRLAATDPRAFLASLSLASSQ